LQIIELAAGGVPWKEHLYELEKQEGIEGAIKFCLYEVPPAPDLRNGLFLCHPRPAMLHLAHGGSGRTSLISDLRASSCHAAGHEGEEVAGAGGVGAAGVL
jgi:hypothetical protein